MEFIKKGKEEASVNINILLCGYPWFRTNHPRGLTKGDTGFFFFFFLAETIFTGVNDSPSYYLILRTEMSSTIGECQTMSKPSRSCSMIRYYGQMNK